MLAAYLGGAQADDASRSQLPRSRRRAIEVWAQALLTRLVSDYFWSAEVGRHSR